MDSSSGYLVLKRLNQSYKVRINDIKRLYRVGKLDTPQIPSYSLGLKMSKNIYDDQDSMENEETLDSIEFECQE